MHAFLLVVLITVSAQGRASTQPDMATESFTIATNADTAAAATSDNNTRFERLMSALQSLGVARSDINTAFYNLSLHAAAASAARYSAAATARAVRLFCQSQRSGDAASSGCSWKGDRHGHSIGCHRHRRRDIRCKQQPRTIFASAPIRGFGRAASSRGYGRRRRTAHRARKKHATRLRGIARAARHDDRKNGLAASRTSNRNRAQQRRSKRNRNHNLRSPITPRLVILLSKDPERGEGQKPRAGQGEARLKLPGVQAGSIDT